MYTYHSVTSLLKAVYPWLVAPDLSVHRHTRKTRTQRSEGCGTLLEAPVITYANTEDGSSFPGRGHTAHLRNRAISDLPLRPPIQIHGCLTNERL